MAQPIACAAVCPSVTGVRLSFTVGPAEPARPTLECEDGRSGTDFAHHLVQNLVAAAVGLLPTPAHVSYICTTNTFYAFTHDISPHILKVHMCI